MGKNMGVVNLPSKNTSYHNNINKCLLTDLGFHGSKLTWSNKRYTNKHTLIKERLDMFLGNDTRLNTFPDTKFYHLFGGASNHNPLILNTDPILAPKPPFRFETMWLIDPSFPTVVHKTLLSYQEYFTCLNNFQKESLLLNKSHFGNIFHKKKKKHLLKRLDGIQQTLEIDTASFSSTYNNNFTMNTLQF